MDNERRELNRLLWLRLANKYKDWEEQEIIARFRVHTSESADESLDIERAEANSFDPEPPEVA